jgi:antitoxin (DNA-binding transcriptional repressor) of toxin-antitoxin stability system
MQTVTLADAQKHLAELVRDLAREGELVITDADKPVARLDSLHAQTSLRNLSPQSVGAVLRSFPSSDDDTLGEMLDSRP